MTWNHRSRPSKEIQSNFMNKEGHDNRLLGPKAALPSPWWHCNCWALVWRLQQATRPKWLGFYTEESSFSTITQGPTLPTGSVTGWGATSWEVMDRRHLKRPELDPRHPLSFSHFGISWLASDRQQAPKWSKLSLPRYRHMRAIFFYLGIKGLAAIEGKTTKRQWWIHRGLMCTAR
jgi:hypothetical protein